MPAPCPDATSPQTAEFADLAPAPSTFPCHAPDGTPPLPAPWAGNRGLPLRTVDVVSVSEGHKDQMLAARVPFVRLSTITMATMTRALYQAKWLRENVDLRPEARKIGLSYIAIYRDMTLQRWHRGESESSPRWR